MMMLISGREIYMQWHNFSSEETARLLRTDISNGLKSSQARERLLKYGKNVLREKKKGNRVPD